MNARVRRPRAMALHWGGALTNSEAAVNHPNGTGRGHRALLMTTAWLVFAILAAIAGVFAFKLVIAWLTLD
jgi:hypothetical protein